jgi:hypothetical protein
MLFKWWVWEQDLRFSRSLSAPWETGFLCNRILRWNAPCWVLIDGVREVDNGQN